MNRRKSFFPLLFVLVMLLCVLFISWYLPTVSTLRFSLEDRKISLETSQGRERKQQHEYDEAVSALAEAKEELERIRPQAEAAAAARRRAPVWPHGAVRPRPEPVGGADPADLPAGSGGGGRSVHQHCRRRPGRVPAFSGSASAEAEAVKNACFCHFFGLKREMTKKQQRTY